MKIIVKSKPEYWYKEECGKKSNTVRILDGKDTIEIINSETGESFTKTITDISVYRDNIIISFR